MKKINYKIEDIRYKAKEVLIGCGPAELVIAAGFKFNDGEKSQWLSMTTLADFYTCYLSDENIVDKLVDENLSDEEDEKIDQYQIDNFKQIVLNDLDDFFTENESQKDTTEFKLITSLMSLAFTDEDDAEEIVKENIGKFVDDLDIYCFMIESRMEEPIDDGLLDYDEDDEE